MKARNINIYILLTLIGSMAAVSCADDTFIDYDTPDASDSNLIRFDVSSGFDANAALSRSGALSEDEELDPVVLTQGSDTLYLHRYVAPEYERATGRNAAMSRSAEINDITDFVSLNKGEGFKVMAMYADTNTPFYDKTYDAKPIEADKSDCDVWYVPNQPARYRYWPDREDLRFNAYAPASAKFDELNLDQQTVTFSYTVPQSTTAPRRDAEIQPDLMFASSVWSHNNNSSNTDNDLAPLNFRHALSAIKFAVRDVANGVIVDISIKGVAGSGSCTFNPTSNSDLGTDDKGNLNVGGLFTWSDLGTPADYTQTFNYETTDKYPNVPDRDDYDNMPVINNTMPEKTFMLIPQTIPDDAMLEITFVTEGKNGTQESKKLSGKLKTDDIPLWEPGKEYIYTISTSSSNWIYVFDAVGNEADGYDDIYVYHPAAAEFAVLGNEAYFSVRSYRERANNPNIREALPWKASHEGSLSYWINGSTETAYPEATPQIKYVISSQWIRDVSENPLSGPGRANMEYERHNLEFLPHYVSTNWKGDDTMQGYTPFSEDKEKPYDLSTYGGKRERTTANCYVVDRGGWYMFPMVYGNAIVNGLDNESSYTSGATATTANKVLKTLKDYQNNDITQSRIKNVNANYSALLIWQDAYCMIEEYELVKIDGEWMIRFFIDRNNLQQGNAILALLDASDTVVWSWHIWATEHWIDKDSRLPHVYDTGNANFNFTANSETRIRERGDVEVTYNQPTSRSFMMAPYNLGWCDPKMVLYLKRKSTMDFVQYKPDGKTETGKTDALPIIQDGITIDYKFANNTYYQWGRKDPMRGYFNHENAMKKVFGNKLSEMQDQNNITLGQAIQNPNVFYAGLGVSGSAYEDWLADQRSNLWNNNADIAIGAVNNSSETNNDHSNFWSHTKTVYDPCPAGYMVPNAGVWHVIQKVHDASTSQWSGANFLLNDFKGKINGTVIDAFSYKVWAKGNVNVDAEALYFSSTGNRWWSSQMILDEGKPTQRTPQAGDNFGKNVSYAWSNRYANANNAYGMALGLDTDRLAYDNNGELIGSADDDRYYVGAQFIGRRAMARPVRAIREP